MNVRLRALPLAMREANALVATLHRHHKPVQGYRFAIGCLAADANALCGAAIVGRPVARLTCQRTIAEVTRLVTDGTPNACSFLYGAAARAAQAMGFARIQTFILESEPGTSLKAAGWRFDGWTKDSTNRWLTRDGRRNDQPADRKARWVRDFA